MTTKILITGANGFIGSHLCKKLEFEGIPFLKFNGELQDFINVNQQIKNITTIFHLGGMSNVSDCERYPDKAFNINVTGTFNLLEAIKRSGSQTRLIFPSTSHVYSPTPFSDKPIRITEESKLLPGSIYALTKLRAENLIQYYYQNNNMGSAIIFRLFNHAHKSQKGPFFFPQMISQMLLTEVTPNKIKVGNLDIYRDFSTIQDLINLLLISIDKKTTSETEIFNVCSSQPRLLRDLLGELAKALGKNVIFELDKQKVRDGEPISVIGSNEKIKKTFNWSPATLSNKEFIQKLLSDF